MNFRPFAAVLAAAVLSACGNDAVQSITASPAGSNIKFFNFGVNAPSVNFYANGTKVTGTSSTSGSESATGTVYGSAGNAGLYSALTPGQYELTGRTPSTATTNPDIAISSLTTTLADGKYYSLYHSGIYNATSKTVESFVVEDPIPATIDYTVAMVRFVNAVSNSSAMTLYAKNQTTGVEVPIGGLVAYKSAGAFTAVPGALYDLGARVAGSSTNAILRTGVTFTAGRVYTITSRGDMTATSGTNKPAMDFTANR